LLIRTILTVNWSFLCSYTCTQQSKLCWQCQS